MTSPSPFPPPARIPSYPTENGYPSNSPTQGSPPPSGKSDSQPEETPPSNNGSNARPGTPDFFLANSTYSMPGAYPVTPAPSPLAIDPRTQSATTSIPYSTDPSIRLPGKRRGSSSSIRNLVASLRRPSGKDQPRLSDDSLEGTSTNRPETPRTDSMTSSTRPLRKKMSGSFWTRRKSSLGAELAMETNGQEQGQTNYSTPTTPVTGQNGHTTSPPTEQSPISPKDRSDGGSIMNSLRKRQSGTFWGKRKSSLGMESSSPTAAGTDEVFRGHAKVTSAASGPSSVDQLSSQPLREKKVVSFWKRKPSLNLERAATSTQHSDHGVASSAAHPIRDSTTEDGSDARMSEAESYARPQRSDSPPPVLPLVAGMAVVSWMTTTCLRILERIEHRVTAA